MSTWSATLTVGTRLRYDGSTWDIVEFAGRRLLLRAVDGRLCQIDVGTLLTHPTVEVLVPVVTDARGLGAELDALDDADAAALRDQVGHVREVLTGYRSGSAELERPGEPRPAYAPGTSLMQRYEAKAAELGIGVRTLRRWVAAFQSDGPAGLIDGRETRRRDPLGRVDLRWLDMCRMVIAEHVTASRPSRAILLARVAARLDEQYGPGVVALPSDSAARRALRELERGTNTFRGSTKGKRSIANRPAGTYGRLRATRPGEYLLLDTTRLDVFAMEPITLRWVQAELTIAMDLYSRCIVGLRLTPLSTAAIDVAAVLYESLRPDDERPYHGVPGAVVVDVGQLADADGTPLLPAVAAETIVVDHGKIYLAEHVVSICERLGISIQPARPYTPTDKAPVERFFRTLREGLLEALPGYKGADVHSRGHDVEGQAFYFLDELEQIIREWVATCYHTRPHDGLTVPEAPGLQMSPLDMFEHGVTRAGALRIPARADLLYDFLPVVWRTVQHYGVEVLGLRYNGPALDAYRNATSPYGGVRGGKWPLRYDPGDVSRLYFQDPTDDRWHVLPWEHAPALGQPFSADALAYARRLAATTQRFPDDRRALAELLARWDAGLTRNPVERRMAVRLSEQRLRLTPDAATTDQAVEDLPTLRRLHAVSGGDEHLGSGAVLSPVDGEDDSDDELDAAFPDEAEVDDDTYYADAMDTA